MTGATPEAKAECGYTVPDICIKNGRLSCMNTSRREMHPSTGIPKGYDGICVTDGYQVYHTLEKELEELTIAGCWVHCRRRFDEALKLISKSYQKESNAFLLMKQIQAIYREEGKLKDLSSDERLKQRQAVIKPLVDAFFAYLKTINVSKKDKFGDAVGYALNQEENISGYFLQMEMFRSIIMHPKGQSVVSVSERRTGR